MSQYEWTNFKYLYWDNKQSHRDMVFTTLQRNFHSFNVRYMFYRAHMNVRMRQFQVIWIQDGRSASNKGSSGRSALKWGKVGGNFFWVVVSCGENSTLLALFIFSIKTFKLCSFFFGYSEYLMTGFLYYGLRACSSICTLTLWRIYPLLSGDSVNSSRCFVTTGKHVNNTRAITRQLLGKRFPASTVEILLDYNSENGVFYVDRAEIL
jgi:hypothetical protein